MEQQQNLLQFQFHKGAIRTPIPIRFRELDRHFNSIKVRLEHDVDFASQVEAHLFQFHKGAIRTASDFVIPELDSIFQFHKGAIRTIIIQHMKKFIKHFNSIKVRLELCFD